MSQGATRRGWRVHEFRSWYEHNPLVPHVSPRDLAPEILLASANIVNHIEHCLKANNSPHLAEQLPGTRDCSAGWTMAGRATVPAVFLPVGLECSTSR